MMITVAKTKKGKKLFLIKKPRRSKLKRKHSGAKKKRVKIKQPKENQNCKFLQKILLLKAKMNQKQLAKKVQLLGLRTTNKEAKILKTLSNPAPNDFVRSSVAAASSVATKKKAQTKTNRKKRKKKLIQRLTLQVSQQQKRQQQLTHNNLRCLNHCKAAC